MGKNKHEMPKLMNNLRIFAYKLEIKNDKMNFVEKINTLLQPNPQLKFKVLDLFAGCGGLSLGFESAGFQTVGYEMDTKYAETYRKNLNGNCIVEKLTVGTKYLDNFDVVIGGPPCQPFSVGGHQKGINDERNGFPAFIQAIKQVKPAIFMFENVRGLLYSNKWYLDEIIQELRNEHYIIEYRLLNAVNFGVPQNRERVFVVGHKGGFSFPKPEPHRITVGQAIGDLIESI